MSEAWMLAKILELREAESPWGQILQDAWDAKNLRGITVSAPAPNLPVSVVKVRAYNVGM